MFMLIVSRFCFDLRPPSYIWIGFLGAIFCASCSTPPTRTWQEADGYRWAELHISGVATTGFTPRSNTLSFINTLSEETMLSNRLLINGSGVAVGDVDGDDLPDIYFTRLEGPNVLYKNLGNWRFEDITSEAGVAAPQRYSTGATLADIDGDADLDLLVTALDGPNALFINDGTGVFEDQTASRGIDPASPGTSMALADADGDGDLDLYIANYKSQSIRDVYHPSERTLSKIATPSEDGYIVQPPFDTHYTVDVQFERPRIVELAVPDAFYLNDGTGVFSHQPFTGSSFRGYDGTPIFNDARDWALSVRFQDFNGDGAPDLYVCNDFEGPDHFWINQGNGSFRKADPLALRKTSNSSMSVALADIDLDGDQDFFVADMLSRVRERRLSQMMSFPPILAYLGDIESEPQETQNTFFLNRGDGTFAETAWMAGLAASEWTWSSIFLDADLDGYEDLFLSTGHYHDNLNADVQTRLMQQPPGQNWQEVLKEFPDLKLSNIAYRNKGDGAFEEVSQNWGIDFEEDVTHGMAAADFDLDGDLDLVGNRLNAPALLMENVTNASRVAVRLKGLDKNTQGIGALVSLYDGDKIQTREMIAGGEYLSDSENLLSFAALSTSMRLEVRWPSRKISIIEDVQPDRVYEIHEASAIQEDPALTGPEPPYFEESSPVHTHNETVFDDFGRQPLLPRRLTELGPGIAIADIDDDGDDDALIGNGTGGGITRLQNQNGVLTPITDRVLNKETTGDITGLLVLPQVDGTGVHILAGVSNYEFASLDSSYIQVFDHTNGRTRELYTLSFDFAAVGALAAADIDQDGDLDLFAAGRTIAGGYPVPTYSRLYEQTSNGTWALNSEWSAHLKETGLATSAVFGDIDNDGDQDLILSTEWGPIKIFTNDGSGQLLEGNLSAQLADNLGWWQSILLTDVNNDQQLDIVAGNWGWNGQHGHLEERGSSIRTYYGDFDNNLTLDLIETVFEPYHNGFYPNVHLSKLVQHLPSIQSRTPSHEQFARTRIENLLGPHIEVGDYAEVNTLSSAIFINRGDTFEKKDLPRVAQAFPIFGSVALDANNDGNEDLYLGGNFHGLPLGEGRIDAGRGLLLLGDGTGSFRPVDGSQSGIKVYGEQRAVGHSDFNNDGRSDLLISQNARETRIFYGKGPAGTQIQLRGFPGNDWGIGSLIAPVDAAGQPGAARPVTAGSGYWTQQSPTQLLSFSNDITSLWIKWPDGTEQTVPIDLNQEKIVLRYQVD